MQHTVKNTIAAIVAFCAVTANAAQHVEQQHGCTKIVDTAIAVQMNFKSESAGAAVLEFELGNVREAFETALHTARVNKFNTTGEMRHLLMLECTH